MELKTINIVEAAGKIILQPGISFLSLEKLAEEMKIDRSLLYPYIKKDDDILMLLLLSLENEIEHMINYPGSKDVSPEEELQVLFENIFKLMKYRPYFLSTIFISETKEKDTRLQNTLLRIKLSVRTYLLEVINHGKNEAVFKNKHKSKSLVTSILGSFRSLMDEQRLITKMVREYEVLKGIKEYDS